MVSRDIRNDELLGGSHAKQIRVRDQVIGVLVMLVVIDVVADVVKERSVS